MTNKMIGIVGGIGSYAGIDLIRKIYDQTAVNRDQEHLPVTMISIPEKVVDRTEYLVGEVDVNPGHAIAEIIHKLVIAGAEVVGIPCNTAHARPIFDVINRESPSNCKILSMPDEVGRYLSENFVDINMVGIMATTGTVNSRIYPDVFQNYGINSIQPPGKMQEEIVHPSIYDPDYGIKANSSPISQRSRQDLMDTAHYLMEKGAQALILGCTEIPLAIPEESIEDIPVIDATRILAASLIRESISK